jgi:hypothetical protein
VNERASSTRLHEESDGGGGEEQEVEENEYDRPTSVNTHKWHHSNPTRVDRIGTYRKMTLAIVAMKARHPGCYTVGTIQNHTITSTSTRYWTIPLVDINDHLISPRPSRTQAKRKQLPK